MEEQEAQPTDPYPIMRVYEGGDIDDDVFEIIDHGADNSSYWQGCGSGNYDVVITGVGDTQKMAVEDLREILANSFTWQDGGILDQALDEYNEEIDVHDECRKTFDGEFREGQNNKSNQKLEREILVDLADTLKEWVEDETDRQARVKPSALYSYEEYVDEQYEDWHEYCEMGYRVSLRFDTTNSDDPAVLS